MTDFDLWNVVELGIGIALGSVLLAIFAALLSDTAPTTAAFAADAAGPNANRLVQDDPNPNP